MYKIIGADQKEYGPVSTEQIRHWIEEGRLNAQSRAQREGGEWLSLSAFEDFADLLRPETAAAPPLPATSAPAPAPLPAGVPGVSREAALQAVKGPAIALMAASGLGFVVYLVRAITLLFIGSVVAQRPLPPNVPPEMGAIIHQLQGPLGTVIFLIIAAINAFIFFGAFKMLGLQSRSLAMAACIVAMLPCSCCCVLGLPFGIWGLVMLNKSEVKSQF